MPLPILADLVGCTPYGTRLSPTACAKRWRDANATVKAGSESVGTANLRAFSHCAGCLVGADRAWFLERLGVLMAGWKRDKQCPKCNQRVSKLFQVAGLGAVCGKCRGPKRAERVAVAVARVETGPPDAGPIGEYLSLHAQVEAAKKRHADELAALDGLIAAYEGAHPEVVESARAVWARIFAKHGPLALPRAAVAAPVVEPA